MTNASIQTLTSRLILSLSLLIASSAMAHLKQIRSTGCEHSKQRLLTLKEHQHKQSFGARKNEVSMREGVNDSGLREVAIADEGHSEAEVVCASEDDCKTPCEELEEAMKEDGYEAPYGGVGCYDGEVLICVYEDNYTDGSEDKTGAKLVTECIQAHEDTHGHQCTCDEDAEGLQTPQNNLQSDENESAALAAEIKCYKDADCSNAADKRSCEALVNAFKKEACTQYEERAGSAHKSCK